MTTMMMYCIPQIVKQILVFLIGIFQGALPLGWIVPDGINRTLEEINEKKVANGMLPGGDNAGAMIISLQNLEPYYSTQFFLVDLETGELFAFV